MFQKAKQAQDLLKMRGEAKKLQKDLAEITETIEKNGFRVKVSGDQKIVYLEKDGERLKDLEEAINEAFKKVQKTAAMKMLQDGGLSSLFGGGK